MSKFMIKTKIIDEEDSKKQMIKDPSCKIKYYMRNKSF